MRASLHEVTGVQTMHKKRTGKAPPLPGPPKPGDGPRLNENDLPYMDPRFDQPVTHKANMAILKKAAELSMAAIAVS